ncbi:hypothetical protein ABW19_dt0208989 [Dactylella cylindrospora]|nr:hypothetical protein ABW19_dt0208989 [Dactylella cylindrospora]
MSSDNVTVHVSNISPKTTEKEITDFFSFCGKIADISITPETAAEDSTLSATVTFEKESAARTALLLDNTQLSGVPIHVSHTASLDELQHDAEAHAQEEGDIRQEDKPRAAILAEYLSHGYVIGDKALQRGIEIDEKHGFSKRFTKFLTEVNSKYKVADKTRAADSTYGISNKANQGYHTITRYFETALETPTGRKLRKFYEDGSKQVLDIHTEARRLADLRIAEAHACTCEGAGPDGKCNCSMFGSRRKTFSEVMKTRIAELDLAQFVAPGTCACAGCKAKNDAAVAAAEKPPTEEPAPIASTSEKATYQ